MNKELTIDSLITANDALINLLEGVTKERDDLKNLLRTIRKSLATGIVPEVILTQIDSKKLLGAPFTCLSQD